MRSKTSEYKMALALSWLAAVILVILPFHAFFTTWAGSTTGHLDLWRIWKELLLVLMLPLAGWLLWRSKSLKQWLIASWIVRLFAVYVLLHTVLGAWALSRGKVNAEALIYALGINLRFVGFFIICALAAAGSGFLKQNWQKIILVPAAVVVLFGLLQKFVLPYDFLRHFGYGPDTVPAYQTVDAQLDHRRIQSTLRGANPFGAYLVLVVSASFALLRKRNALSTGLLTAAVVAMFYTYSRSAWIGVVISLALLAGWSWGRTQWRKWLAVFIVALGIILSGAYLLRFSNTAQDIFLHTSTTSTSSETSNEARLASLQGGVKDVWRQPLGMGPGTAGPASLRNNQPPRIAENYYLQLGQEIGIAGAAIFIIINLLVAVQLWQQRKDPLARILLASLVGLSFVNMLSHAWADDTLAYLWWGLAGIACAPAILTGRRKQDGKNHQAAT